MSLGSGTTLGSYEIVEQIGAGGMGEVYRARDTKLRRDVALKVLPEAFICDADRLSRFRREAQLLAALNHPNIGAIYGLEEANGVPALVLELIEGPTLADRIKRGALPVDEALDIAGQIAEALEAAHERGIVHRDLKPANVKLTHDGRVKVLDFGLARALESSTAAPNVTNSPTLSLAGTQAGVVLGTAAYMSPEQARGLPADTRSDVFSFGVMLYEMVTARTPFSGDTVADILAGILARDADLTLLPPSIDPRLKSVIQRCLDKNPKKRWQAVGDLRVEIESIRATPMVATTAALASATPSRASTIAVVIVTAAIASAITSVVWRQLPRPTPPVARFSFSTPEGQALTRTARQMVDVSPDGTAIVYAAAGGLFLHRLDEGESRLIPGSPSPNVERPTQFPMFSPDGADIVYWTQGALYRIAAQGGTPTRLLPGPITLGMSWEGDHLILSRLGEGIVRLPAGRTETELLVSVPSPQVAGRPQVLPGGTHVLFAIAQSPVAWDRAEIVVQRIGSTERTVLIKDAFNPRYIDSGHLLVNSGGSILAVPFDLSTMQTKGAPVPVVDGVRRTNNPGVQTGGAHYAVSGTGMLVYSPGAPGETDTTEVSVGPSDGKPVPLRLPAGYYTTPRFSPDGKLLALATEDGQNSIIWIYDLSGASVIRRLTFAGRNRFPVWLGNDRVAFQSDREGDLAIFAQAQDGTDTGERLTRPEKGRAHLPEAWVQPGNGLLYSEYQADSATLWTLSLSDGKVAQFGSVRSTRPLNAAVSTDGRWVAYTIRATGSVNTFAEPIPPTGSKFQVPATGAHHPMWGPGDRLFYSVAGQPVEVSQVMARSGLSFSPGTPLSFVQRTTAETPRQLDISPDGKTFVVIGQRGSELGTETGNEFLVVLNWLEELKKRVPVR